MKNFPNLQEMEEIKSRFFTMPSIAAVTARKVTELTATDRKVRAKSADFAGKWHFQPGKSGVRKAVFRHNSTPKPQIGDPKG